MFVCIPKRTYKRECTSTCAYIYIYIWVQPYPPPLDFCDFGTIGFLAFFDSWENGTRDKANDFGFVVCVGIKIKENLENEMKTAKKKKTCASDFV